MDDVLTLQMAEYINPEGHPLAGQVSIVNAFMVRHPDGVVLVDTGIGWGRERFDAIYGPGRRPLEEALADQGLEVGDIKLVANSHLHFDHCGGNRLFPGTPIYVQKLEYEAAQAPRFTVNEWFQFPSATYRQVTGPSEIVPGLHLIPTPGHTRGHQSVLIETDTETVLLACQAIYTAAEYEYVRRTRELPEADRTGDSEGYLESALRLIDLNATQVRFSHDNQIWGRQV